MCEYTFSKKFQYISWTNPIPNLRNIFGYGLYNDEGTTKPKRSQTPLNSRILVSSSLEATCHNIIV